MPRALNLFRCFIFLTHFESIKEFGSVSAAICFTIVYLQMPMFATISGMQRFSLLEPTQTSHTYTLCKAKISLTRVAPPSMVVLNC
jgi:hypothetical protein